MATSTLVSQIENGIRRLSADPLTALKSFDLKTVGLIGVGIVFAVLLVDLLGYLFAFFKGTSKSYIPISRSLALSVADAWDNRENNLIGDLYDPYTRGRSLDTVTELLDSLSDYTKKWANQTNAAQSDGSFVFHRK